MAPREEDQEIKFMIVNRSNTFAAPKGTKGLILTIGRGEDFVLAEFPPGTHNREIQRHLGIMFDHLRIMIEGPKV